MEIPVDALVARALADPSVPGWRRAVGRLLSRVENDPLGTVELLGRLPSAGQPWLIGVTGAPGAGKSTLIAALVRRWITPGGSSDPVARVAVVAVDPSSPFSGGALLGDRVRMAELAVEPGVLIRSMAARGRLGGLSAATPAAVTLLSRLGFDRIVIETVGVGQNEVDVMGLADSVVVVTAPGLGDDIQAAKAGVLEIADLLVVNKADREGAGTAGPAIAHRARSRPRRRTRRPPRWRLPVVATCAETGAGLEELLEQLSGHRRFLADSGQDRDRAARRSRLALETIIAGRLTESLRRPGLTSVETAARRVSDGTVDLRHRRR